MIVEWALNFAFGAIGLAMLLTTWRLVVGPESIDRVLAIDTLYINTVGLVILLGMRLSSSLLFEAALVIAMLGFIGTVALSRFVMRGDVIE
jgi:multicomponent K+:H+ antiporter subunit F